MKSKKVNFVKDGKGIIALIVISLLAVAVVPAMIPGDKPTGDIPPLVNEPVAQTITHTVTFGTPYLTELTLFDQTFTHVNLRGVYSIGDSPGTPTYLVHPVQLLLPSETEVVDIEVAGDLVEFDWTATRHDIRNKTIDPYQPPQPVGNGKNQDEIIIDTLAYESTSMTPGSSYYSYGVDYCRGYPILTLNLYPTQYIPGHAQLFYYPELSITITVENTGTMNQFYRNRYDDREYVKSLVINPEDAAPLMRDAGSRSYPGGICDPADHYDYVVITRQALVDFTATYNWSDLIALRQSEGLTATVVASETITAHPDYDNPPPFDDNQAKIREFCKDAYADWGTQYVLIAGDHEGSASIPRRLMDTNYEGNIESDLYWSNLDETFNDDGDGDWGEEGDTGFDLYSELFIGSVPCDEGIDISNWLTKVFFYAANYEEDYLENMAFYGGNTGWSCQGDDFIDFTFYGTDNWLGPDPNHDGPWPSFLGFLYGFDTWNATHPGAEWNNSVRWTAEPPNPGWQGGSESVAIAGLKAAINNDDVTQIYGIAHANSGMSLDVYDSTWESQYHNTKPFFIHDYGCHCGDMSASSDGVLHSMLFHDDVELAFAAVFNTCYGWGNLYCTNSSSALQQKLFVDYMFNESKSGGFMNWQLGRVQAWSKDQMAPTILWDYSYGTFRAIIQGCLLFGDPAQSLKPPLLPEHNIVVQSLDVPSHVIPDDMIYVNATLLNNGQNDETNVVVSFRVNGTEIDSQTIPLFETLATEHVSFTWTPSLGWYTVCINVTIPGVAENITGDNDKFATVVAGADVAVIGTAIPAYAAVDSLTPIEGVIKNHGAQNEFVDVTLDVDGVIQDTISVLIETGKTQTVTFLWNPTYEGLLPVTISVSVPNEVFTNNNALGSFSQAIATRGFVLLVDDDQNDNYETYYQDALMASGYLYDYWDRGTGCPTVTNMDQYSAVVWFTGDDSSTTLVTEDINTLTTYLDGGGRLFISGQDVGYDIGSTSFYSDYLHASFGVDDTNIVHLDGIPGCPIGDGLSPTIATGDGANNQNWPSGVYAVSPGTEIFQYQNSPYYAGIKADPGTFRTVYFAFGFEAINTMWDRAEVMNRTITWLATGGNYTLSDLMLDPANLDYVAAPGSIFTDTVTIGNHPAATGNLTYQFTNLPAGVTVVPSSGDIAPGWTESLTLTFDTTTMTGNLTHFFLTLDTNDPDEGLVHVPVYISLGFNQFTMPLYMGWNMVTAPLETTWTAEDMGQQIPGCTIIAMFDAGTQSFTTHVVGTPHNDFPILEGMGYFVYVTADSNFTSVGKTVGSLSIQIYEDSWNLVGWCHAQDTTADMVADDIPGTTLISMFDAQTQQFVSHINKVPWDNFVVERGMGLFVYTTQTSIWDGAV